MVFWDNRVIELIQEEVGAFSISYHCKIYEDNFKWYFIWVYGPILDEERKTFWAIVPNINGLWNDLGTLEGNSTRLDSLRTRGIALSALHLGDKSQR